MTPMTPREVRLGLIAFALLLAGLAVNLLGFQGIAPTGGHKARGERGQPVAADKAKRRVAEILDETAEAPGGGGSGPTTPRDPDSVDTIRAIQRELRMRGYETGSSDGVPGLMTRAAIMAYEHDHGLPLTGEANEEALKRILLGVSIGTAAAPAAQPGGKADRRNSAEAVIRTVQQALSGLGYNSGVVDGKLGEDTQRAIRDFEIDSKLPETGRVSGVLIARLAKAAAGGRPPGARQ